VVACLLYLAWHHKPVIRESDSCRKSSGIVKTDKKLPGLWCFSRRMTVAKSREWNYLSMAVLRRPNGSRPKRSVVYFTIVVR
jgi:hypothetical protein